MTAIEADFRDLLLSEAISDGLAFLREHDDNGVTLRELEEHLASYHGTVLTDALRSVRYHPEVVESASRRLDAGGARRWMVTLRAGAAS